MNGESPEKYRQIQCTCGVTLRFPNRENIRVTCPKCRVQSIQNPTRKLVICPHCNGAVKPSKPYGTAVGSVVLGVLASAVIPQAGSSGINKAIRAMGENWCPKCEKRIPDQNE